VQVNVTVTFVSFQPLAFGAGEPVAVMVGSTLGWMFTVTLVEAELPALSVAVPLIGVEPIVVSVTGDGQVANPDKASEQVKVTVALP
jgi:hypothetical protein